MQLLKSNSNLNEKTLEILNGVPEDSLNNIMKLDETLRKRDSVSLLTPDARILFWLRLNGSGSMNDALIASNTSYASFFNVLRRLKAAKLITADKDKTDNRVRRLSLNYSAINQNSSSSNGVCAESLLASQK